MTTQIYNGAAPVSGEIRGIHLTDPSAWKKFLTLKSSYNSSEFAAFSRYRARYNLARGLESITVAKMAQATEDSYFVALRVTLAYTALESLEKALSVGPGTQVKDENGKYQIGFHPTDD